MPRHQLLDPAKAEREWIVAAKLCHPNVIQLRDVQVSADHIFLVMAAVGETVILLRSPLYIY